MRKAPYRPTEAYLAYVRVGYKGLDKIRRQIAQFLLGAEQPIPRIPQPRENVTNIVQLSVEG